MDGRQPNLESQAASAIAGHVQAKRMPTDAEIRGITDLEATDDAFFSSLLRTTKKWWLLPIVLVIVVFSLLIFLSGTGVAPLIYTLF